MVGWKREDKSTCLGLFLHVTPLHRGVRFGRGMANNSGPEYFRQTLQRHLVGLRERGNSEAVGKHLSQTNITHTHTHIDI